MPKSSGNLREFPKTSETLQFFKRRFMKILENLCQSSETFEKLRKLFKSVFQFFLRFFKIFGKSSEMFGNFQKTSETVK